MQILLFKITNNSSVDWIRFKALRSYYNDMSHLFISLICQIQRNKNKSLHADKGSTLNYKHCSFKP